MPLQDIREVLEDHASYAYRWVGVMAERLGIPTAVEPYDDGSGAWNLAGIFADLHDEGIIYWRAPAGSFAGYEMVAQDNEDTRAKIRAVVADHVVCALRDPCPSPRSTNYIGAHDWLTPDRLCAGCGKPRPA